MAVLLKRYISEQGLGHTEPVRPPGYSYNQFSRLEDALSALSVFPTHFDAHLAYLHLGFSPLELPVFAAPFGWARQSISALSGRSGNHAWLATQSFEAGLALGLVFDPNFDENVFEVARWHAA